MMQKIEALVAEVMRKMVTALEAAHTSEAHVAGRTWAKLEECPEKRHRVIARGGAHYRMEQPGGCGGCGGHGGGTGARAASLARRRGAEVTWVLTVRVLSQVWALSRPLAARAAALSMSQYSSLLLSL